MSLELAQRVVDDCHNKHLLSDGVFTFARLHSDRLSLYINLTDLLVRLYELQGLTDIMWISLKNHEGEITKDHMHMGLFHKDPKLKIGAMIPDKLWKMYESKSIVLEKAPDYQNLSKTLPNYFYEKLK